MSYDGFNSGALLPYQQCPVNPIETEVILVRGLKIYLGLPTDDKKVHREIEKQVDISYNLLHRYDVNNNMRQAINNPL